PPSRRTPVVATGRARAAARRRGSGDPTPANDNVETEDIPLDEDIEPEDGPVYEIGPATRWHPDRVRMWMAVSSTILMGLVWAGLYALILMNVTGERLVAWQGVVSTVSTLTVGIVAYFFSRRNS